MVASKPPCRLPGASRPSDGTNPTTSFASASYEHGFIPPAAESITYWRRCTWSPDMRQLGFCLILLIPSSAAAQPLPGTKPLEMQGDRARQMLDGIDRYLTRVNVAAAKNRDQYWKPDYSSPDAYVRSLEPN